MANYSRRELKRMIRTRCAPVDAPGFIFRELERIRKKECREAKSPSEIMDKFMLEDMKLKKPRPWISGKRLRLVTALKNRLNRKSASWMIKFREFMLDTFWDY